MRRPAPRPANRRPRWPMSPLTAWSPIFRISGLRLGWACRSACRPGLGNMLIITFDPAEHEPAAVPAGNAPTFTTEHSRPLLILAAASGLAGGNGCGPFARQEATARGGETL